MLNKFLQLLTSLLVVGLFVLLVILIKIIRVDKITEEKWVKPRKESINI